MTCRKRGYSKDMNIIFNCLFGLLLEEIAMAVECINPTYEVVQLQEDKQYPEFDSLNWIDKKHVIKFFRIREKANNFAVKMIHLESSVQLVFYLTLLIVNLNEVPLLELNYNEKTLTLASLKWIAGLIWFLLKTILSGYITFAPIFMALKKDSYKSTGLAPRIIEFVCVTLEVILELIFSATFTFLEWVLIHK